ncbi:hypothetical protein [Yinghuangia seranimata]|uniref:hypothetical protein n=1 Tax=Yinghuangia seranimata TaxID=408067 RepID=UPI00248D0B46|nr:hypothetical protein [Yinghuangia seranimata]MDI2130636.1 hypothetical protein [Yinghuangia seranimata]
MSDDYTDLRGVLPGLTAAQAQLYAYGCALRLAPVVDLCAEPETAELYGRGLAAARTLGPAAERAELARALRAVPENEGESAEEKAYWVYHAALVLVGALILTEAEEPAAEAVRVCAHSLNLHENLDYEVDPDAPRPGPVERAEVAEQFASIDTARGTDDRAAAVTEIARRAAGHRDLLGAVLPPIAEEWV